MVFVLGINPGRFGGGGLRTTDNELYLENVFSWNFGWALDPYVSNLTRTALDRGYNNVHRNYSDDSDTPELEAFKFETGIETVTKTEFALAENILAQSLLRLFTRFEQIDVWGVRFDNTITARVNSFLNVNLTYLLIYEKKQSPKTQMKETPQPGIVYTLL